MAYFLHFAKQSAAALTYFTSVGLEADASIG
jgi:hypothetical protein